MIKKSKLAQASMTVGHENVLNKACPRLGLPFQCLVQYLCRLFTILSAILSAFSKCSDQYLMLVIHLSREQYGQIRASSTRARHHSLSFPYCTRPSIDIV